MVVDPKQIRVQAFPEIGSLIQRDAPLLIDQWKQRALQDQPTARHLPHNAILDHLSVLLREMGRSLATSEHQANGWHSPTAEEHGKQRWDMGWSLEEVVRDYQLLRLVIIDHLEQVLGRPLQGREVMAVGLVLDESIAASISRYVEYQEEAARRAEREQAERERQAEEARLQQQAEALREAARQKDEFMALLGHELRNPLAALYNALHVLRVRGDDPATVSWAHDVTGRQVQQLIRLVDDLLDVARMGRGKVLLRRERLDLAGLVARTLEDHRRTFEAANVALVLESPAGPVWIQGDAVRLAQVLGNLLSNAVKFTDALGRVTVRVEADAGSKRAVVRVRDTGIGIEPEMLARLFEPFAQAEENRHRSRGGLGLGLALVKGLIELHGGTVAVSSPGPGKGTEMTLRIPLDPETQP
jgi:signal transduction histidine kinase